MDATPTITKKEFKNILDVEYSPLFLFWDIETGPLPKTELVHMLDKKKIKYPKEPGVFDPSKVKTGNRGPEKKQEYLAEKRAEHYRKVKSYETDCKQAEVDALDALYDEAALNAVTNVVLAIGYGILLPDGTIKVFLDEGPEKDLTRRLWYSLERVIARDGKNFTWNGEWFDIPIMTQKAWKHKETYRYLRHPKYKSMDDSCVDAKKHFSFGQLTKGHSLANVARFLGVPGKLEGVDGSMFHQLYNGGQRERALQYLWHDVDALYQVSYRLGLLDTPLTVLKQRKDDDE